MQRRSFIPLMVAGAVTLMLPVSAYAQVLDINDAINKAGRQRMAANYLSASWGGQTTACAAEMSKASEEFVKAHGLLKNVPESTPAIRAELQLVESQFAFFDIALKRLKPGLGDIQAQSNVFTTSERILQVMDGVTGMYSKLA